MKTIIHFFRVHAPPGRVYRALTTEEGLSGWWTTTVKVEPGVGGHVDFTFLEGFNPRMQVTALEENRRVDWTCVGGHDNWKDNTFSFALHDVDGETGVMFRQGYARELSDMVYGEYNFNWGYYLGSLKKLCETDEGTPYGAG